jgi:pantetheine-phosphate adenylyltransferase
MSRTRRIVIYPGSFDPVTNGHLDIVQRAARLFDHVIVAVAQNPNKRVFFSTEDRLSFLRLSLAPLIKKKVVSIDTFQGLLVHYAAKKGASAIVRGLRAVSDFEFEFQMALMNRHQSPALETVYLMPDEKYTYLSSTMIKEISRLGGKIDRFLPKVLQPLIRQKMRPPKA